MPNEERHQQANTEAARTLRRTTAEHAIAIADALDAFALSAGTTRETRKTVRALREIADFTHDAAIELAIAGDLGAPEPRLYHNLASWKLKEVGATLALHLRGGIEPVATPRKPQSRTTRAPEKKSSVAKAPKSGL